LKCGTLSTDVPVRDLASAAVYIKRYTLKARVFFVSARKTLGLFRYTMAEMKNIFY